MQLVVTSLQSCTCALATHRLSLCLFAAAVELLCQDSVAVSTSALYKLWPNTCQQPHIPCHC
jgi:hypothetical protein